MAGQLVSGDAAGRASDGPAGRASDGPAGRASDGPAGRASDGPAALAPGAGRWRHANTAGPANTADVSSRGAT